MTMHEAAGRLRDALSSGSSSARLQAAMTAGTSPAPAYAPVLVARCAIEPDFFVREALTWALTRHDRDLTVALLLPELTSAAPQARSQALHTLSKLGDARAWPAITAALLTDADDGVARAAWRTASGLVPAESALELAQTLSTQFGRGELDLQRSLSRAFATIGPSSAGPVETAASAGPLGVRVHALATLTMIDDPEADFDDAVADALLTVAATPDD